MEIYRNLQKTFHRSVQMKIHRNLQIPVSMHTYTQRYIYIYVPAYTHTYTQCYVEHLKCILCVATLDASVKKQKSWADCNVVIRNTYYKEDGEVSQKCPDEDLQKPSDSCKHTCTHTHKGMCMYVSDRQRHRQRRIKSTHMHMHTHSCMHACMHVRMHIHTHTHTHTH